MPDSKETDIIITPFEDVYDLFFAQITDDYYMETSKQDTYDAAQDLLIDAIPWFEFPRVPLDNYVLDEDTGLVDENGNPVFRSYFPFFVNNEEKRILSTYMVVEWLGQQLASVENVRMKFSGSDFKFTSQANHLQKLSQLKKDYTTVGFHLQRLYKRRIKDVNGIYHSTLSKIVEPDHPIVQDTSLYPKPDANGKPPFPPNPNVVPPEGYGDYRDWYYGGLYWRPLSGKRTTKDSRGRVIHWHKLEDDSTTSENNG